ncbi:oxidoreductase [Nodosilinea sp. LEGE 07088]|uniref:NADH-quinone oxidoreductase subunit B family protein n=1 Tax=Nodosilinea sp. LEGE 07088 TaxID=2777968 RepID=UPI00187F2A7F|nr:oxidoreductase [Nodosilinea sp. LEGE 07088]MBE9137095.1 oxidoreductase [Nodosilinea sp. LEGE 07088]
MTRIKLATVWLGGCSGCHMSFLDLDEWLFELAQQVELVYSPFADVKTYPEGVDVALVEGAVANQDHLEMIRQVRDRSQFLISFGDCAVTGNVTAIRNVLGAAEPVLTRAYLEAADVRPQLPEADILPPLLEAVMPVHQVVPVDCYLPGCPPNAERIRAVLEPLLRGDRPALSGADFIRFG